MDLAVKVSRSKKKRLRKRSSHFQRIVDDVEQPLKPSQDFISNPGVGNELHVSSLQDSGRGSVESLLDCSPRDLRLKIKRLDRSAVEERYPRLVGCNWEVFTPNHARKAKSVGTKESLEERVSPCMELEQPGSCEERPMYYKHLVYHGGVEFSFEEIRAGEWRKKQPGSSNGPFEIREIVANGVDSFTQTLPDDSLGFSVATNNVNDVEPSHRNVVNESVSPHSPEGSGRISPDDSLGFSVATNDVNDVEPSHRNVVNEIVSPDSPEGSGGVSPVSVSFDCKAMMDHWTTTLQEWMAGVVELVGSFQRSNQSALSEAFERVQKGIGSSSQNSSGVEQPGSGAFCCLLGSVCDKCRYNSGDVERIQRLRQPLKDEWSARKKCEFCDLTLMFDSDLINHAELIHGVKLPADYYVGKSNKDSISSGYEDHKKYDDYPSQKSSCFRKGN